VLLDCSSPQALDARRARSATERMSQIWSRGRIGPALSTQKRYANWRPQRSDGMHMHSSPVAAKRCDKYSTRLRRPSLKAQAGRDHARVVPHSPAVRARNDRYECRQAQPPPLRVRANSTHTADTTHRAGPKPAYQPANRRTTARLTPRASETQRGTIMPTGEGSLPRTLSRAVPKSPTSSPAACGLLEDLLSADNAPVLLSSSRAAPQRAEEALR
jgi:hypothetical protein